MNRNISANASLFVYVRIHIEWNYLKMPLIGDFKLKFTANIVDLYICRKWLCEGSSSVCKGDNQHFSLIVFFSSHGLMLNIFKGMYS